MTLHQPESLIQDLETSEDLRTLDRHVPVPTFMRALGLPRSELAHSRVIAFLLNRYDIAVEARLVPELLLWIADQISPENPAVAMHLIAVAGSPSLSVDCKTERWNIDIVTDIISSAGSILLGIENKIDAREQGDQLAQYQERLLKEGGDRVCLLLFLTPDGREPRTSANESVVPVLPISYQDLYNKLNTAIQHYFYDTALAEVVRNFQRHLKEEIVADTHVKGLVLDLWKQHPKAMRLAMKYRPRLDDIRHVYVEALETSVEEELYIRTYPNRGHLREIKMTPKQWWDGGMPLTFMFYSPDAGRPSVRILVGNPQYDEHKESLQAWAESLEETSVELPINTGFPRWGWWYQLLHEDVEQGNEDTEPICDEETAVAAADKVLAWLESLRPTVDPFLGEE